MTIANREDSNCLSCQPFRSTLGVTRIVAQIHLQTELPSQ